MRSPYAITLLILGSQLVSADSAETTCGTCVAGYICKAGECVLDTARLTGNPLPILTLTSDNPGGPIKTTGMSGTTDTATGEVKTTSAATGGATMSTGEAKTTSNTWEHSSSSPSMTSQVVSTSAPASSSSVAAAATSSGVAGSLVVEWDSWVALGIAWAVGLPLLA